MTKGIDKYSIDSTDYTVGQDNVQKWGFDVHNVVFVTSAGLTILFLLAVLILDPVTAKSALDGVKILLLTILTRCLFLRVTSLLFFAYL